MGICIAIETELHEEIELLDDDHNVLKKLIGYPDAKQFPMLASIDWYGDTTFNQVQLRRFLEEWETLYGRTSLRDERALLDAVRQLGEKALAQVHHYLVFIGD